MPYLLRPHSGFFRIWEKDECVTAYGYIYQFMSDPSNAHCPKCSIGETCVKRIIGCSHGIRSITHGCEKELH